MSLGGFWNTVRASLHDSANSDSKQLLPLVAQIVSAHAYGLLVNEMRKNREN